MTPEQIATLPDDLISARHAIDIGAYWNTGLVDLAAERICALEEQAVRDAKAVHDLTELVKELRWAIALHRSTKDFNGPKDDTDRRLWAHIADVPWGKPIKGDG